MSYLYHPTEHFKEKLEKIRHQDPPGFKRIWAVIERLLLHPDEADGTMHGAYHKKLKKYVGRKGYRLIYHWCSLCRKESQRLHDACEGCGTLADNSVIFFDVYHKKDAARIKRLPA